MSGQMLGSESTHAERCCQIGNLLLWPVCVVGRHRQGAVFTAMVRAAAYSVAGAGGELSGVAAWGIVRAKS